MNVSLTPELERRVAEKVEAGLYTSASELVRESLRLLFEAEDVRRAQLAELNSRIQLGLDQLDLGQGVDGAAARRRAMKRFGG